MTTDRTAAARKARHLNALRRKAPAMVEALRELGYTVIGPDEPYEEIVRRMQAEMVERRRNLFLRAGKTEEEFLAHEAELSALRAERVGALRREGLIP